MYILFVHVLSNVVSIRLSDVFYRAFNSYYGKIARTASEEVILSLMKAQCIPCLLYGLESCTLGTMESNSLNVAVKRIMFKIFRTNSNDIAQSGQLYFNFPDMSVLLTARKKKFLMKFSMSDNCLCSQFKSIALTDLQKLIESVCSMCKQFIYCSYTMIA